MAVDPVLHDSPSTGGAAISDAASPRFKVVDLFAGVGGLSLGAARAGFDVVAALDSDKLALQTHARNFPKSKHLNVTIDETYSGAELLKAAGLTSEEPFGLVGGPPCQGFSVIGRRNASDTRNELFEAFFRLVAETRPSFYLAENVPGILDPRNDKLRDSALARVPDAYKRMAPFVAVASDYGAPTSRARVFFIGYRLDALDVLTPDDFAAPADVESVTVRDALAGLPTAIDPAWQSEVDGWRPATAPQKPRAFAQRLREHRPEGIGNPHAVAQLLDGRVSGCLGTRHLPAVVERFDALGPGQRESISRAARLDQSSYCPTIRAGTGNDRGRYQAVRPIHPTEPRVITPREAARLQGFPDWFVFHPTKWHSFRQIGNSVSPIVAEYLLRPIRVRARSPLQVDAREIRRESVEQCIRLEHL